MLFTENIFYPKSVFSKKHFQRYFATPKKHIFPTRETKLKQFHLAKSKKKTTFTPA
jgi:hypothetical protein